MQYRKKPVTIEAVQFTGDNIEEIEKFVDNKGLIKLDDGTFEIPTLEGNMRASVNDFIIRGIQGEYYPCKPDIFYDTYDLDCPIITKSKAVTTDYTDAKLNKTPEIYYRGKVFTPRCWKLRCVKRNLEDRFYDIKHYFQRARNGYCRDDVWNINTWFLETLSHMLNDLLVGGMGYPGYGECDTFEKWQAVLKRMKYCCEEALEPTAETNEWEDTFNLKMNFGPIDPETHTGSLTFDCDNEENHQKYMERQKEIDNYQQSMQDEALRLFVKWFNHLWD